jgi:serine/threonine protein kinase
MKPPSHDIQQLPVQALAELDRICVRFERALRSGERPGIEDYLTAPAEPFGGVLFKELLALELDYRRKRGESPSVDDYAQRFPDRSDLVHETWDEDNQPRAEHQSTAVVGETRPSAVERQAGALPEVAGYEVLRELGRGGMAVVYLARDRRLERFVALKLISAAEPNAQLVARFRAEAQAVARLQHPNIVQIHEIGEHGGRPYLALEFVNGGNLADRIAGDPQPARDAAQLVELLARAVHTAHQHGIIHRDLKPSNVLLQQRRTGLQPVPPSETDWSAIAADRTGARPGMGMKGQGGAGGGGWEGGTGCQPVLRREEETPKITDFGLVKFLDRQVEQTESGVLVGTASYMAPEQTLQHVVGPATDVYALGAILYELITGRPPFKAATVLETAMLVQSADPVPPRQLQPHAPRDIETVCLKCLEKDPNRRYASALDLADDLTRFLADLPVRARPVGSLERVWRWGRRNPAVMWGSVAVAMALLIGAALSTWQAIRATRAGNLAQSNERRALDEAAKVRAVNSFLSEMLGAANPENAPTSSQITVHEALGRTVSQLDNGSLADQPHIEAAVRAVIGNTYRALADFPAARKQLERAVELGRRVDPGGSDDLTFALNKLARLMWDTGQLEGAESLFVEALAMARKLHGPEHEEVAKLMNNLGYLLCVRGRLDESRELLEGALAMRRRIFGNEHSEVATSLNNLAILLSDLEDHQGAEKSLRESLAIDRRLRGDLHPNVAATMNNLATVLKLRGEFDEAEALYRESLDLREEIWGPDHPSVAVGLNNLALFLEERNNLEAAESLLLRSLEIHRRARVSQHPNVGIALENIARVVAKRGQLERAISLHEQALANKREVLGDQHPSTVQSLVSLARLLARQDAWERAESLLAEASHSVKHDQHMAPWLTALCLTEYGQILTRLDRFAEAEPLLLEAHAAAKQAENSRPELLQMATEAVAQLYDRWDRPDEARRWRNNGVK